MELLGLWHKQDVIGQSLDKVLASQTIHKFLLQTGILHSEWLPICGHLIFADNIYEGAKQGCYIFQNVTTLNAYDV